MLKKSLSVLLLLCMVISMFPVAVFANTDDSSAIVENISTEAEDNASDGADQALDSTETESDTYQINSYEDLVDFRDKVNGGDDFAGKTVVLNADIDLTGKVWTPIGTSNYDKVPADAKKFAGTFDGQNHTITGLSSVGYVPAAEDTGSTEYSFGLFGYAYGANFKNVKFANVNIECGTRTDSAGNEVYGSGNAALVGYYVPANEKTSVIDNCHVLSGTISASNNMGGLIGHMDSQLSQPKVDITISNCSNAAAVTTEAREAGGILGLMNSSREGNYIATMRGIVTFENCINTGDITSLGGGAPSAGGILGRDHNQQAGQHLKVIFDGCKNSGTITVTANGETHAAGIGAGYYAAGAWLIAKDCVNTGDVVVNGSGDVYAGGLISYGGVVELINSTSTGTVTGNNKYVGDANSILFLEKIFGYADTVSGNTYHLNGGMSPERAALVDDAAYGGNFHLVETAYKTVNGEKVDFLGWYDNAALTGEAYTSLGKNVKHYYAKWSGPVAKIGEQEYNSLQAAVDAATDGAEIVLLTDVTLVDTLVVPVGKNIILNLDGYTIGQTKACTESYSMIENKGDLTITGEGRIVFADTSAGDPNFGWGSYTIRNEGKLVVENGTIEHLGVQEFAKHMICAIFQYSGSTTINGGTISTPNYRSVRLWKGDMTINGGTFDGQVWVQAVDATSKLTINGGTFAPNGGDGSSVFVTNNQYDVALSVTGGTFETKIGCSDASKLAGAITGGTFTESAKESTNEVLVAKGYIFEADGNGTYGVVPNLIFKLHIIDPMTNEPAFIPYIEGNDLASVIAKGKLFYADYYNMVLEILDNCTVEETIVIDYPLTIDLNDYTLTGVPVETKAFAVITNKSDLTIKNGSVVCDHQLAGSTSYAVNTIVNSGTLTIYGATIENKSTAANQIGYAIDNNSTTSDAVLVINAGEVKASGSNYYDGIRLFCNSETKKNDVTVNGGNVSSIWLQNPSDGTEKNTKDVLGSVTITGGEVAALYLEPSANFTASVTGGTITKTVEYFQTSEDRDLKGFITGGKFTASAKAGTNTELLADGYAFNCIADKDGYYNVLPEAQANEILIYTVEDLIALDKIVEGGNMLEGVTVYLMNDLDLSELGKTDDGEPVSFSPIGANSSYFKGTFDGQGHTIKNMYQSGWALGFDWDHYGTIGLFAYLWNATIKNLTIENAECFVEGGNVGAIAGCAWGDCTFENIRIKNSELATYNNRAGGIVGYTGGSGTFTFKDIIVYNDTVIAGLWGSFDSSLGGIMGQLQASSKAVFDEVHVECRIDAYNDVTASYKYYAYRMCGMLVGRMPVDENNKTLVDNVTIVDDPTVDNDGVSVTFGEWARYHYIWDDTLSYGCKRIESGYAYDGIDVTAYPDAKIDFLPFKVLFGGQQYGCYGIEALDNIQVTFPGEAQINGDLFWDVNDAIKVAVDGETVTLRRDIDRVFTVDEALEIDTNGNSVVGVVLANVGAIVKGVEGLNVTTTVEDHKVAYKNGVYYVTDLYVAKNTNTNTEYETLEEALAKAGPEDEIDLIADVVECDIAIITKDVTLDLNGKTLVANYLVAFNGNDVVDNATAKGKLVIDKNNISLASDNAMMPVWNEKDGYVFIEATIYVSKNTDISKTFIQFKPNFGTEINALFADGMINNHLGTVVRLTWINKGGNKVQQDFIYSDDLVENAYANTKYLEFTSYDLDMYTNMKVELVVVSDLGVECTGASYSIKASENS